MELAYEYGPDLALVMELLTSRDILKQTSPYHLVRKDRESKDQLMYTN
jgi:hypothetical protein